MSKDIIIAEEVIASKIYQIRNQKVMLDSELAELYGVETRRLNEQVKRNETRFPHDFMFQLTPEEWENLKSQNATSSWGGRRKLPKVFTEQGVAMLSSVLNSETAIEVNIQIIRVFTRTREVLLTQKDILLELENIKQNVGSNNKNIEVIFKYLNQLEQIIQQEFEQQNRKTIGYKRKNEK